MPASKIPVPFVDTTCGDGATPVACPALPRDVCPTNGLALTPRFATAVACLALVAGVAVDAQAFPGRAGSTAGAVAAAPAQARTSVFKMPCGDLVGLQVLLAREGFSPGQIDGRSGSNTEHAIRALQGARDVKVTGVPDCATWRALGGETSAPTIVSYTLTSEDALGPFEKPIPRALADQAKRPTLGYQSAVEQLAERFHTSPAFLARLNPGPLAAGREIRVPAVAPFDSTAKPAAGTGDVTVEVVRDDSSLRVTRADGTLVLFVPVTTGSEHDPLPPGDYKVTGVSWNPPFHYNPDLFWDSKPADEAATFGPGPNNPVGITWISLSLEHYGLHGTPEPGNIGHTESHGCVRMTNWDAARVAALVKPGTPVHFR
jgi:lipoprotein-anchoring transpeptidase ErfK/SrfK